MSDGDYTGLTSLITSESASVRIMSHETDRAGESEIFGSDVHITGVTAEVKKESWKHHFVFWIVTE